MGKEITGKYLSEENEYSYINRKKRDHVLHKTANLSSPDEKHASMV